MSSVHTFTAVALLSLAACGPSEEGELEACEHLAGGPASSLTAALEGDGPAVSDDHRRYDITLVPTAGGNGGRVHFAAAETAAFGFFLDKNVPLSISDANGDAVTVETVSLPDGVCSELGAWRAAELNVGTWVLDFGPTSETSVSLVVEEAHHH